MTGFARGVVDHAGSSVTVEIKSLNHRFLDIFTRLPRGFNGLDIQVRNYLKGIINRGRIEVSVTIDHTGTNDLLEVDLPLAGQYYRCLDRLRDELGIREGISLQDVLRCGDVIKIRECLSEEEFWPVIRQALDDTMKNLLDMRRREGETLSHDIQARLDAISTHLEVIARRIPISVKEYRSNLQERIRDTFNIEVPDERLEQEMIVQAEKSDVTEEKVRLDAHIRQMRDLLAEDGPVGRKMDFLVQELYREANTLGSKTLDVPITTGVVEIKSELEKIREQIQNIE
ncbi:MAG: YicC/YloC family endoribonuclease [bacterium]